MENQDECESEKPPWKPIEKQLRRVVGVLIEKAKTTPDSYPMTLNAITTAANQKSNRSPKMQLTLDEVEEALDELRQMGAVAEIQGDGRKSKYKHRMYEWLGVDKVEIAVMAELLLRGQQSLGELRARAARMEKIEGLSELKPIVKRLVERGLMIELTPEGRGQLVTHALYMPEELAKIERLVESTKSNDAEPFAAVPSSVASDPLVERIDQLEQTVNSLTQRIEELETLIRD